MEQWRLNAKKRASNQWHVGDGKPDIDALENDLYFDKQTNDIYRKLETWERIGNIRGSQGKDGYSPLTVSESEPKNATEGDMWLSDDLMVMNKGVWVSLSGRDGRNGTDGKEIEIRVENDIFQWSYKDSDLWLDLIDINALRGPRGFKGERGPKGSRGETGKSGKKGKDAKEIELRKTKDYIQWRRVGGSWKNLVSINQLSGFAGAAGGGGGITINGITEIIAGTNITVDNSNPQKPIVSATGGGAVDSVNSQTGVVDLVAEDIPYDDNLVGTSTGGAITGDNVQLIIDNFIMLLATSLVPSLFAGIQANTDAIAALESGGGGNEPRDQLNILIGLEDRDKYAVLGSGKFANYDAHGFTVDNPGDFTDGGFDIYNEYVPLWQGASPVTSQYTYQEIFSIGDTAAWGGDLVETAIVWKGRTPIPFVEVTPADSATENPSMGYGEYPSLIYQDDEYNGEVLSLQRARWTYDPSTGNTTMYRPVTAGETADSTAFGVDWLIVSVWEHPNPGSHPMADIDPTEPLHVGKGSGRWLVSRVTVNQFDGTPYCDFNPVENTVDDNTVYDPVLDANWTNASSSYARVIDTREFVDAWLFSASNEITNPVDFVFDTLVDSPTVEFDKVLEGVFEKIDTPEQGTNSSTSGSPRARVSKYVCVKTIKLTKGYAFVRLSDPDTMGTRMVWYEDVSGVPGDLLAVSDTVDITNTTAQEIEYDVTGANQITITEGTVFWRGVANENADASLELLYFGGEVDNILASDSITWDTAPDPFGSIAYDQNGTLRTSMGGTTELIEATVIGGGGGASGYDLINQELTSTYAYAGYENSSNNNWWIYRRTRSNNLREYATGTSGYATAWTNRASEVYS